MQELRLVLIVLGAVAIAALLLHGLWSSKKEKPVKFAEKPMGKLRKIDNTGFDQDGIGSVRVIKTGMNEEPAHFERKEPELDFSDSIDDPLFAQVDEVTKQNEKEYLTRDENHPDFISIATEHIENKKDVLDEIEPEIMSAFDKNDINDFDVPMSSAMAKVDDEVFPEKPPEIQQHLIIINVQARNNLEFDGPELLNFLEQYGMLYGEMDIFHRHADLAGTGKVLFSAANMYNPGSFPLATIHQFTTPGVTFFMTLPCHGEAEQNFKLMLQTAQQVADQLGGLVTDENRAMLTPKRLDDYREEIKQFHIFE